MAYYEACLITIPMNQPFSIVPPPELVQQWINEEDGLTAGHIATQAAQWGADQELDACCEWLQLNYNYPLVNHPLRVTRRPKPPTLKEQALAALEVIPKLVGFESERDAIRHALEALSND
jgi:hypothetical protein